jgi:hypothetical protein
MQIHNQPPVNSLNSQSKDNSNASQLKTIFHYLQDHVATASMVSEATGVKQKNICRYKADLQRNGMLWEIEKKSCKVTGFKAYYLTTNPELAPLVSNQLKMF